MRSVVVTGASTGIGYASAKTLIATGFRVFGSVRNKADAERVSKELGANFTPLLFDVTDEQAVKNAASQVRAALKGETLAIFVLAVAGRCSVQSNLMLKPGLGALAQFSRLLERALTR